MRSALCLFDEGMEASAILYCQLYEGLPQFLGSNHVSLTSFDRAIATVLRLCLSYIFVQLDEGRGL